MNMFDFQTLTHDMVYGFRIALFRRFLSDAKPAQAPWPPMSRVEDTILANLGTAARQVGLPMHDTVLLAQDGRVAVEFIASVLRGDHDAFLASVDWEPLFAQVHASVPDHVIIRH